MKSCIGLIMVLVFLFPSEMSASKKFEDVDIYRENKIKLQKKSGTVRFNDEQLEHTFFHELIHFIFYFLGEGELGSNEKLVDTISGLLHQAIRTMK